MATVTITSSQNLTSVVYAADDDLVINQGVTLTITATPTNRIRSITGLFPTSKLQVTNTSTANMLRIGFTPNNSGAAYMALRFENGALCQMDGDWITIYTGTGASNQTVLANLNSVGGQLLDYLPGVEVETGSGTGIYKKWVVLPRAVTNFTRSPYGFNSPNYSTGTVAVSSGGVVTGTGTTFDNSMSNKRFRAAGQAQDYLISTNPTATSFTLLNPDGTTYSGPTIAAGATYVIKSGSAYETVELGSGAESGTALWYDPLTSAITCGDGTNGLVIPNGAKVRIPNIFVTSDTPSTTLSAAITGTTAAAISLTDGTFFSTNAGAYSDTTVAGSLLIIDSTSGESERIGYTSRTGNTISATGMVRGAFYTVPRTHANGSVVKFIAPTNHYTAPSCDFQTGGSLVCTNVIFGSRFSFAQVNGNTGFYAAKNIYFEKCFISQVLISQNFGPTGSFTLKNSIVNRPPDCTLNQASGAVFRIDNASGAVRVNDVFVNVDYSRCTQNAVTCGISVVGSPNISEFTTLKVWAHRPQLNAIVSISVSNLAGLSVDSIYTTGNLNITDSTDCIFSNLYFASGCLDPNFGNVGNTNLLIGDGCLRNVFRGIKNYDNLKPCRSTMVDALNGSSENVFQNSGISFDLKSWGSANIVSNTGSKNTFAYISAANGRSTNAPVSQNNIGYGSRLIKIRDTNWNTTLLGTNGTFIPFGGYADYIAGPQPNCSTQSNFDIQPFTVCDDSSTASGGFLCCGPFLPEQNFTAYISGLSATAYLTGSNEIAPTTNGDQVTISSVYAMKGISQFDTAGTITYGGTSSTTGLTYEFRMCNWGDSFPAGWTALTLANLESARAALSGYSTSIGINIQMRITATTTVSGRRVYVVRMPAILDTTYTPAVASWNFVTTNVLIGSTVALSTDNGATWSQITTAASSTVTLPVNSFYTGSTINYKLRVRKAGYDPIEISGSVKDDVVVAGKTGVSVRVDQTQIVDSNGAPVYGNGTTSALVSLDFAALRIDIGNGSVSGPDLYDTVTNNAVNSTGIKYAWPISSPGLAGGFDVTVENTWKLRRKLVTDTNAAISKFVLYGPNPALSPVDTVNGSVALSHTFTMTVSGLLTGSAVALSTNGGTSWSTTTAAGTSVTFPLVFTTYGGTINYTLRVRKAGYDSIESSGSVVYADITIPVTQAQTLDANGQPIYGNGTTSALVSIDAAALRIDIGNGSVNGPDLYDTVTAWACGTTGIQYAYPISSPGLAGYFDCTVENTWKLRRKLVTDTNAAISVFVLYGPNPALSPVDTVNGTVALSHTFTLAVTGSLSGSVLAMSLDGGSTWTTATSTGATVNFSVVFTTYGGTKNYIVRVRKAGYTPLEYSGSLVYQSGSVPAAQVQVVDINGVAVYGRGPGTTTAYINIVPGSLRVDIGNILVVGEDLYDYIAAWEATTTGIQYPEVLQFNGTDSIILNSFKLRRNVAGSTNAMIDMIVFYGPNTALNPVDEANGSVQLFPRVVRQGSLSTLGAAVWDYQTSSATTSGSMGERLKDASTVATNGQQLTAALS